MPIDLIGMIIEDTCLQTLQNSSKSCVRNSIELFMLSPHSYFDFILYPKGPSKRFTEKNMMRFWANFAKNGIPIIFYFNKEWTPFINENNKKSIMILEDFQIGMQNFNKDLNSLITELELSSVINFREQCALLFQVTTFVGEDVFDDYQERLNGKCTRDLAKEFLEENSGVLEL